MVSQISQDKPSNAGFYPIPKEVVRTEVQNFAEKANYLAEQILAENAPSTNYTGPVVIRNHYYSDPFWIPWYQPRTVVPVPECRSRSPRERERENNAFIGVVAAVVGGIAIYSMGSAISRERDANSVLEETHEFQNKLTNYQQLAPVEEQPLVAKASEAAHLKERICTRIKNSAAADLCLRTGLFGGCAMALAGVFAVPALITAGTITGVVATSGMLFKWGLDSTNGDNIRDAEALKASVKQLSSL